MKKIPIDSATNEQVRAFAQIQMIDLTGCDTPEKVRGALETAWIEGYIFVEEEQETSGQTESVVLDVPTAPRHLGGYDFGPIVYLKIMESEGVGGKQPATPSVNGREIPVSRNVLVGIPYAHYLVLDGAYNGSPSQADADSDSPKPIEYTHTTNYPLSNVTMPSKDEIAAWHASNGPRELGKPDMKIAA